MTFHGEPTKEELLKEKIEEDLHDDEDMELQEITQETCPHEDIFNTGNTYLNAKVGSTCIYDEMICEDCGATIYEEYRFTDIVQELPKGAIKL